MDSTFEGISDILQDLNHDVPVSNYNNILHSCSKLQSNISNILKYEISTVNAFKCKYTIQNDLINTILCIQSVLYDSETCLSAALATSQISDMINLVLLYFYI